MFIEQPCPHTFICKVRLAGMAAPATATATATTGRDEIVQEFYNNVDHQELIVYNVQPKGTLLNSLTGTYGRVEKVGAGLAI